jgi:hypothetical protein
MTMKNRNNGCLYLFIVCFVLGLSIKLCTNKNESTNIYKPTNLIDTAATNKDTVLNNKPIVTTKRTKKNKRNKNAQATETVSANYYSTPITKTKRRTRSYSSSSNSSGCSSRQCYGTTKKGGRCRNITTSCNGYCWRHGG